MPARKLKPNIVPEKPWQHILVDFIIKLLVSFFLKKKINNLLHRAYRQTMVATFVTTYKGMKLHEKKRKKKEKKRKEKKIRKRKKKRKKKHNK